MADIESQVYLHDEPELPPLPQTRTSARQIPRLNRKRTIDEVLYNASSDPPLFSSDDASSTIENYAYQRPKRLYRGTWWTGQEKGLLVEKNDKKEDVKRRLSRNFDSGVWMGSESSISDEEVLSRHVDGEHGVDRRHKVLKVKDLSGLFQEQAVELSVRQQAAADQVARAVIENNPTIDLSSMYLDTLPWEILKPLETFASEPTEEYQPFSSGLRIYLAHNRLTTVPPELFTLSGLSILSLRNNELTEIPPAIRTLASNLSELNLSINKLNYLPMEVCELFGEEGSHPLLRLSDNLFYRPVLRRKPDEALDDSDETGKLDAAPLSSSNYTQKSGNAEQCLQRPDHAVRRRALYASWVAYMDFRGLSINGPIPSRDAGASPSRTNDEDRPRAQGKTPSLYEIAIRSSTVYPLEQLLHCLGDDVPPTLLRNLTSAAEHARMSFQACSICKRKFSIARTEWIEWQDISPAHSMVPLLYRGCSWECVPNLDHLESDAKNCGWKIGDD